MLAFKPPSGTWRSLKDVPGLILPTVVEGRRHVFHLFVIQVQPVTSRNSNQTTSAVVYPTPIHLHPAYSGLDPAGAFRHSRANCQPWTEPAHVLA